LAFCRLGDVKDGGRCDLAPKNLRFRLVAILRWESSSTIARSRAPDVPQALVRRAVFIFARLETPFIMSASHPLRTLEGADSAEAWPEGWGCEVPPGSILVGAGKCEHSSLAPHRPGDLHSNRQAFRGKPAWDGNGGDPERTHGLRSIANARGERQVRGIRWTDVGQLLGWRAIGCDDQIDFLECRLNRAPELVELVARRGIFGGRDCLPDLQSVPEQGPVQFWNSFEIGPMVGIGF